MLETRKLCRELVVKMRLAKAFKEEVIVEAVCVDEGYKRLELMLNAPSSTARYEGLGACAHKSHVGR